MVDRNVNQPADRKIFYDKFWQSQLKHKCFYDCGSCMIKNSIVDIAKHTNDVLEVQQSIPKSETCEIVVSYTTPYWWLPIYKKFTFMIVSDKGHYEFFRVCKVNIGNTFRKKSEQCPQPDGH